MSDQTTETQTASEQPSSPGTTSTSQPISRKKWFIDNVVSLFVAVLLVLVIRSSVIESFKIPSGSMIPTLVIGDYIFVNKFSYGLKLPFSDWFGNPVYLTKFHGPERGDVIVFKFPKDPSIDFIKRVVGLPGDTVEVRDKVIYINGQPVPEAPAPQARVDEMTRNQDIEDPKYTVSAPEFFVEHLGNHEHITLLDKSNQMIPNFGPVTVPAGHYFMMGDNRDVSNDSRFWGFVPAENIKGKAVVIWFSIWLDFSDSIYKLRLNRMGTLLR